MDNAVTAGLIVLLVIVAGIAVWMYQQKGQQKRRTEQLRDQFGPEYDHAIRAEGDRSRAEADLDARAKRVEQLDIRPLSNHERKQFAEHWHATQARFVDDPRGATEEADELVAEVMRVRGYPVGDFEHRAANISVDHPAVMEHYRVAHAIAGSGSENTEELRTALVHYRVLFDDLLETQETAPTEAPR
jgi:hypothetical protein